MTAARTYRIAALTAALSLFLTWPAAAAVQADPDASSQGSPQDASYESPPDDPLGRGSPRGAIRGFLESVRERDYERAAEYLDLSRLPAEERESEGSVRASQLRLVLDRLLWVEVDAMSGSGPGNLDDELEANLELVEGTSVDDAPRIGFFLQRGEREPGVDPTPIWRVAPSTVERVPELYARYGPGLVGDLLPRSLVETAVLDVYLWQWIGLILALVAAYLGGWVVASILARIAKPIVARSKSLLDDDLVEDMIGPVRLAVAGGAFAALLPLLKLTVPAEEFFHSVTKLLVIVSITWLVFRAIDLLAEDTRRRMLDRGQESATYLIPTGSKALKFALGVLVLLSALDTFGFDVTTLIAGLGVGGLAVALALRPTLENVFGGIAVLVDEPVRPGQFCKFGDKVGTVEEVGLRSTRIRTLDRTVISVPNSEFSNMQIENYARRDRMRLTTTLGLRYETSADQLRHVTAELRRMLLAHPRVLPDPFRVRFVNFGAYSLDLEIFLYVDTPDYNEFLAVKEDLFLRIIGVVERSGTGFAFPSSTTYLSRDGGLDGEKTKAAEGAVQAWREEQKLPFPDFDAQTTRELRGSLDWPPEGSSAAPKST